MKKLLLGLFLASAGLYAQDNKVKFTAEIQNRNSDSIVIKGRNFNKVIKGKDGKFSDTFEAPQGFYQLGDGTEVTQLYLTPGSDITLKMDAKMFDETIKYSGKGSAESNVLAYMAIEQEKLDPLMEKNDQQGFLTGYDKLTKDVTAKLGEKDINDQFRTQMTMSLQQSKGQLEQMFAAKAAMAKLNGTVSPDFEYENHKGGKTKLSALKGKYVYIDTWATWCGPCRQEIPHLAKVEEKYHGKNIEFVSVSIDAQKDHDKWKKFVDDKKLGGVQVMADKDWNSDWAKAYGIQSIPRFILIGPDGKIIDSDAPRPSDPNLVAKLDTLVK
ncbi:TlpA family protein disulfide reductase [Flavobacterium sp. MAH-1]|uniref:TlpA family protein disulfide reductase n=1 Tax=Flavobacterium agri TaxID=2743471 RepID=A0A7Y9C4Z4_9FLAO|nr:TlpA disulfide reductase family protein [Flavobacterium agri]NUY80400.1 TlpA family protein disulfide reductase [Flavobacterium agri]NYA70425.1 TlpA family protein disulfide reductase [Flavobacterium agri]